MDQRTVQTLQLLQSAVPFDQLYGFALTQSNFAKSTLPERSAILHYLLSIIDKTRSASIFKPLLTLRPFKLRDSEQFKTVAYAWVGELSGFEQPFKQEFLSPTPRNQKMLYVLAHQCLEMQIQRLIRELGDQSNVKELSRTFNQLDLDNAEKTLRQEMYQSKLDWDAAVSAAQTLNQKLGVIESEINKNKRTEPKKKAYDLDPQVKTAFEQINQMFKFNALDLSVNPKQQIINLSELRFLQQSTKQALSEIRLQNVFQGLKMFLQHEAKHELPQQTPVFQAEFKILNHQKTVLTQKESSWNDKIQALRGNMLGYYKQEVVGFDRQEFNLLNSTRLAQKMIEMGSQLRESKVFTTQILNESQIDTMKSSDMIQVKENLASRLKRTIQSEIKEYTIFKGGDVEGVRELLDAQ
ncbi:Conserved_hypothetical protein [Hexamita inflata]|uniref:Uncharacterized protein n=1 Tax=Hexamita inflata TaxID=28002 RepID=A0AA86R0X5_9EUKA|nr:Conserved hypothetical protein [Hexamita inflata]